jgi:hypothetical protein
MHIGCGICGPALCVRPPVPMSRFGSLSRCRGLNVRGSGGGEAGAGEGRGGGGVCSVWGGGISVLWGDGVGLGRRGEWGVQGIGSRETGVGGMEIGLWGRWGYY